MNFIIHTKWVMLYIKRRDHLIMSILTILIMDLQINMKKIEKNRKKTYRYIFLLINWWWVKFYVISLSLDSSSKTVKLKSLEIYIIFWWSLMDYQMIMKLYEIWITIIYK
jgi:hypothetical protein